MTHTETAAPAASYAVVVDGHTAREALAGYALPGLYTRAQAVAHVETQNAFCERMDSAERWHAEHVA